MYQSAQSLQMRCERVPVAIGEPNPVDIGPSWGYQTGVEATYQWSSPAWVSVDRGGSSDGRGGLEGASLSSQRLPEGRPKAASDDLKRNGVTGEPV